MPKVSVRLSDDENAYLEKLAAQRTGATVSDVIRNMLYASKSLEEVKEEIRGLFAKTNAVGQGNNVAEILRLVTLIAKAMPAVARHV